MKTHKLKQRATSRKLRPAAPGWKKYCGYCGRTSQVVTDGKMLLCGYCGH